MGPSSKMGAFTRWCAVSVVLGGLVAGCSKPPVAPSRIPQGAVLAPYDARAAGLFDDVIEPNAVGLLVSSPSREGKIVLEERTRHSHVVTRARVQTVTSDLVQGVPVFHVVLAGIDAPLAHAPLPEGRVELEIGPMSPAYGIVKSLDSGLVGRTFVGFFRWFSAGDEPRLFWHLSADAPDVITAVREASL